MKPTRRQRANLRKHANYLYALPNESKFDMRNLALDYRGDQIEDVSDVKVCGTIMCSLGYAALCFPRIARRNDSWDEFCLDIFGMEPFHNWQAWDFLFSMNWTDRDNTITGAADRIIYFLEKGVPLDNWNPEVYQTS